MRAGELDKLIEIQINEGVADSMGQVVPDWRRFARVWARVRSIDPGIAERYQADREVGRELKSFVVRYIEGISFKHRIVYKGNAYTIRTIKEVEKRGRDHFLEIYGEYIDD